MILMHICCGPCAVYPIERLTLKNIEVTGYFYNPNIHPAGEHKRRRENVGKLSALKGISVIYNDSYMESEWLALDEKLRQEDADTADAGRCEYCYRLRFEELFRYAAENGYETVTTSLLVSPYQKHDLIIEIFEELSRKTGISFYYEDFRAGFRAGQNAAREMGLYRQKYCGCILS